jgi:hypothetical protein
MKGKHSLKKNGLSLSQAQSISNLCNQRSIEIDREINTINNFKRVIKMGSEDLIQVQGNCMPENILGLLSIKAKMHAVQAFLMENIKEKNDLLEKARCTQLDENSLGLDFPEQPKYSLPQLQDTVGEDWGWKQLTEAEYQEYLEAEAYASHLGQFIHKGGKLDELRRDLSESDLLQWIHIQDGVRTPVILTPHHTPQYLMSIHEQISALHRTYEQRVNYFKAKVKNLVTEKNSEIEAANAKEMSEVNKKNTLLREEWKSACSEYEELLNKATHEFESQKEKNIKEISQLRIEIPERFKSVVDEILSTLE